MKSTVNNLDKRGLGVWMRVGGYPCIGMDKTGIWDVIIKSSSISFVTNFIQLISPQPVNWFSQTKLH